MTQEMFFTVFGAGVAIISFAAGMLARVLLQKGEEELAAPMLASGRRPKRKKETNEEERARIISENIENYGTAVPQKEVSE